MKQTAILVVDDNHANLAHAKKQFEGKNVTVTYCNLYSVAAQLLKSREFDVLLTDLMMIGEAEGVGSNSSDIGKEVPYGLILSILAKNMGVSHVAILTDISHHASPIAWAMDTLLGSHSFVSGFNEGNKNWLRAAQRFVTILDSNEAPAVSSKKTFLLAGVNDTYKKALQKKLESTFDVVFIADGDTKSVPAVFAEQNPDVALLIGEISGTAKDDEGKAFKKLIEMKNANQKVVIAGWLANDDPHYLRLPFTVEELLQKVAE